MSEQSGTGVQQRYVSADEHDMRLDRWFKQHFPGLTHGQLEKLLRKGKIRLDGGRVKANARIAKGQTIRIPPMPADKLKQAPKKTGGSTRPRAEDRAAIEAMTIYEDAHVLVLNKPHGLAVQGGSGQKKHIDGMLAALEKDGERPRLVHRLDKDTSGVLILGKTAKATRKLTASFRARDSFKLYWALTVGTPTPLEGDIDAPLAKSGGAGAEKMGHDEDEGKHAITRYAVIDSAGKEAAWLALRPITGRTHQLRVHLQILNTPILGDGKYGGADARLNDFSTKLHLHAQRLILPNPGGGMIDVTAPPPPHFIESLKALGFALSDGREGYERLIEADG